MSIKELFNSRKWVCLSEKTMMIGCSCDSQLKGEKNDNPLLDEENMTPPETVIQHADEACHM